jgi:organic hydroperoxide reductase OsmC/OhrA
LLFCVSKRRVQIRNIHTEVTVQTIRNESGRLRIGKVDVVLSPGIAPEDREKIGRCLDIFEDFCTVTQSIRDGIDVDVRVEGV